MRPADEAGIGTDTDASRRGGMNMKGAIPNGLDEIVRTIMDARFVARLVTRFKTASVSHTADSES
jgi:hypothetical protein